MSPSATFSETDLIERFPQGTVIGSPDFNRIAAANSMVDLFAKKDASAVDRYFKEPYTNHSYRAGEGIAPLYAIAEMAKSWEGMHTIIRRALVQDDLVVLHSVYSNIGGDQGQFVAFDMFRLDNGKIIEHWDCLEDAVHPDASGLGQISGTTDITYSGQEDANRAVVTGFIETVAIEGKTGDVDDFLDTATYVDHSVERTGGFNRPLCVFTAEADAPEVTYVRHHNVIAEGNFVLVQGEGRHSGSQVLQVFDLFRLESGKIVEHWDVLQALPPAEQWRNTVGPF